MSGLPFAVPSRAPSTPPPRRTFTRSSPPDSLTLSPTSPYSYSETDAFLSPRFGPPTPLTPQSPSYSPLSPSFFHPHFDSSASTSNPFNSSLGSPPTEKPSHASRTGYFDHVPLPPTTKRTRRSRLCLGSIAGVALVVCIFCIGVTTNLGGTGHETVTEYSNKVSDKLSTLRNAIKEKWASGETIVSEEALVDLDEPELSHPVEPTYVEEASTPSLDVVEETGPIKISALPTPRRPSDDPSARYLGFLPHSGYHNQRSALQNALLLGKLLNRTVLVPPIWIGWPISTEPYDDLSRSWRDIMLLNPSSFNISTLTSDSPLNEPTNYASTVESFPCPTCSADDPIQIAHHAAHLEKTRQKWESLGYEVRPDGYPITELTSAECKSYSPECRHTYKDSFLSYDFLVDLEAARLKGGVEIVDRWDMREKAVEELLNVGEEDIYVIKDRQAYDFHFTDVNRTIDSPLISLNSSQPHFNRDISIPTLSTLPHRVLLFGSLFGWSRIESSDPQASGWSELFAQSMAFSNDWLLRPANEIVDRLGGQANFVGVHARVGDGEFAKMARSNMEHAWREVVRSIGVEEDAVEEMWNVVKPEDLLIVGEPLKTDSKGKRHVDIAEKFRSKRSLEFESPSSWAQLGDDYSTDEASQPKSKSKRGIDDDPWSFLTGPTREPSTLLRNLVCRSPLHTDPRMKPFNRPLYLATDSRNPTLDANLRPFFDSFPCTFILSDFDRPDLERNEGQVVESVGEMMRLENELDGVQLGRLFLPFLEAIVAAKGKLTVGTPGSTFSGFAAGALHRAYWN